MGNDPLLRVDPSGGADADIHVETDAFELWADYTRTRSINRFLSEAFEAWYETNPVTGSFGPTGADGTSLDALTLDGMLEEFRIVGTLVQTGHRETASGRYRTDIFDVRYEIRSNSGQVLDRVRRAVGSFGEGFVGGGQGTIDFVTSLGTVDGWVEAGKGFWEHYKLGHPLLGWNEKVDAFTGMVAYANHLLQASDHEIAYTLGYGTEKLSEALLFRGASRAAGGLRVPGFAKGAQQIGGGCFVANTPVLTQDGLKPIQEVEAGDLVWSYNEFTGEFELRPVYHTQVRYTNLLIKLVIGSDTIYATDEHPFRVGNRWIPAGELLPGMPVLTHQAQLPAFASLQAPPDLMASEQVVLEVTRLDTHVVEVFNFGVDGFATYTIGTNALVVHNTSGVENPVSLGHARSTARKYLQGVSDVPRGQLIDDLHQAGFKKVFEGKGMQHFQRGSWKIRLDPPHAGTLHNHMHINRGGNKSTFDIHLNPVNYKSPAAHIPIK